MSKSNSTLTAERVREVLDYDPETGVFTRRTRSGPRVWVGDVAGFKRPDGYMQIKIEARAYLSHRLAWLWVTGEWPVYGIDHIDGVKDNNRIANLREADQSLNAQNLKRARVNNKASGLLGVTQFGERWQTRVVVKGVIHHLGTYDTAEQAHSVYLGAKRLLHPGCTI